MYGKSKYCNNFFEATSTIIIDLVQGERLSMKMYMYCFLAEAHCLLNVVLRIRKRLRPNVDTELYKVLEVTA